MYNKNNNHIQSCMATRLPSWAYLSLMSCFLAHSNVFLSPLLNMKECSSKEAEALQWFL